MIFCKKSSRHPRHAGPMMGRCSTLDVFRRSHPMTKTDTLIRALDSSELHAHDATVIGAQAFGLVFACLCAFEFEETDP
jgi:hypothetical protein